MPDADIQKPDWLLQMEAILEMLNEGLVIADDALRMLFVNDALLSFSGYRREGLLGRTPAAIFPPEDLPYLDRQHAMAQRNRHHRHEFYLPHKDGGRVPRFSAGE